MKNSRTSGKAKYSQEKAAEKSNILSPTKEINIPARRAGRKTKVLAPFKGGAFGWFDK